MWKYNLELRNRKENLDKKYAGVYAFYVVKNGHNEPLYVGSSIEIQDRLSNHLYYLRQGKHRYKAIQEAFDNDTLQFVVLDTITFKDNTNVVKLETDKKEYVFYALSRMEEFYMELFKDTILNKQKTVKVNSTKNKELRSKLNAGENNPNCKYPMEIIAEIIWLKNNTDLKHKVIVKVIKDVHGVVVGESYISQIGKRKWINLTELKPNWYSEVMQYV